MKTKWLLIIAAIVLASSVLATSFLKKKFDEASYVNYMTPKLQATQKKIESLGLSPIELADKFNEFFKGVEAYEQEALQGQGFASKSDLSTADWAKLNLIRDKLISEFKPQIRTDQHKEKKESGLDMGHQTK